jgi:hypothetical protein
MFKVTCLIDPQRKVGTPRKLGLESNRKIVQVQRYLSCYMNAQKERGSDSENFGERITEFGVTVAKI